MSFRAALAKKVADKVAGKVAGKVQSLIAGDYRYQRLDAPPGSRDSNSSSSSSSSSSSGGSGHGHGHGPSFDHPERPPPPEEAPPVIIKPDESDSSMWARSNRLLLKLSLSLVSAALILYVGLSFVQIANVRNRLGSSCDTVPHGYQCYPSVARNWGQYAPFFSVSEEEEATAAVEVVEDTLPAGCRYTFAQVLSRHGSRDPTAGKSLAYADLIARLQTNVTHFANGPDGAFAFLANYKYELGADELTRFGERQMIHSGAHFYGRYRSLVPLSSSSASLDFISPFVRSSGQHRVLQSALGWIDGFHEAHEKDSAAGSKSQLPAGYQQSLVVIPETDGFNNTLSANGMCTAFSSRAGVQAQDEFAATFVPAITTRLNRGLPGAALTDTETLYLMDLCPFETIADESDSKGESSTGGRQLSPFCGLFSEEEWRNYDYYQTLGKWYGFGDGSVLGATQGVGYVNELVARLTQTPVDDHTSTNWTLDADPATFPLNATLYADFSHDNDMANIFAAMGLYNQSGSALLPSNTTRTAPEDMHGYAASWVVPFAARLYVEKMVCGDDGAESEELVRVLVNDRVVPLAGCGADSLGRCTVTRFVESLEFARSGGRWDECFA